MNFFSFPTGTLMTNAFKAEISLIMLPPLDLIAFLASILISFNPTITSPGAKSGSFGAEAALIPADCSTTKNMNIKYKRARAQIDL
jgi:hypothetical protein